MFTALVLGGLFLLFKLPVELLPSLSQPRLTVLTVYEHAPPQEVEALVTRRLEAVLGTVAGVRRISSVSSEGLSSISLFFDWGHDISPAAASVREKLDAVVDELPRHADPPLVLHFDPSQAPVITLALSGEDLMALRLLAREELADELQTLKGVAQVRISGGLAPEVQVLADRGRLSAHRVDLATLVKKIEQSNLNAPAGEVVVRGLEMQVRTLGRFSVPAQILEVPLTSTESGSVVLVSEVAKVEATHKDITGFARVDGRAAVLLGILKEPQANTVEVSSLVRERCRKMAGQLPAGVKLTVVDDVAPFITDSLQGLRDLVVLGGLLAFGLLVAFLRRPGAAALVVLSVPVSLLATLALMYAAGVGLNLMSVGGLALGVGMLVDGSIVVLEAFHRHRRRGKEPLAAAQRALSEVRGGLLAGAATTCVVLVPLVFMTGLAQQLFLDFAYTLAASLAVSLLVALFLLPAMLVWRPGKTPPAEQGPGRLERAFDPVLQWCLGRRALVVLASVLVLVAGAWGLWSLGASLLPELGEGRLVVRLSLPPEAGVEQLGQVVDRAEKLLMADGAVASLVTRAGVDSERDRLDGRGPGHPGQALITVVLKEGMAVRPATAELRKHLSEALKSGPGLRVQVLPAGDLAALGGDALEAPELLVLTGEELPQLRELGAKMLQKIAALPVIASTRLQGAELTSQLIVRVRRPVAASLGVTVEQVAGEVRRAVQGEVAGRLIKGNRESDIRVRLQKSHRKSPRELGRLPLTTEDGGMVLLSQVASLREGKGPVEVLRSERRRAVILRGQVRGAPFSLGQARAFRAAGQVKLPPGYRLEPGSSQRGLMQSLGALAFALGLALLLIYVILVVQFESLSEPLVILLGLLPVAAGPALVLKLMDIPVSALVLLGFVVLLGMAVNASILLVSYAGRLRTQGRSPAEALRQAARVRLMPILLSTLTTVLGALPLCLGWGGAAAVSRPLALTVAAGLLASLPASLLLVPVLQSLFTRHRPEEA